MKSNKSNKNQRNGKFPKHGTKKKKSAETSTVPRHIKNFKYSQRNKETEDSLKRQAAIETKFRHRNDLFRNRHLRKELEAMDEEQPEENYYEKLVNSMQSSSKSSEAIENSETDSSDDSGESEEEEALDGAMEGSENMPSDDSDADDELTTGNLAPEERKTKAPAKQSKSVTLDDDEVEEDDVDDDIEEAEDDDVIVDEDPYLKSFKYELKEDLVDYLQADDFSTNLKKSRNWPQMGRLLIDLPRPPGHNNLADKETQQAATILTKAKKFSSLGEEPQAPKSNSPPSMDELHIKRALQKSLAFANRHNLTDPSSSLPLTPLQRELFTLLNNYQDLYLCNRSYAAAEEMRLIYTLHAINHVLKSRSQVIKHNGLVTRQIEQQQQQAAAKRKKKQNNNKPSPTPTIPPQIDDEIRDQGLVRPKVLIIAPLKDAGYRIVNLLIDLLVPSQEKKAGRVINHKRFVEEFAGDELTFSKRNPKPDDYQQTFQGNTDDNFRLGVSLTKQCVKLYADFYSSDLIIASPLGLRMIVGAPGDEERDYDFLASLELVIVDQMDVIYAQNWDHLLHVFGHMHLQPQSRENTDFSRVRSWSLNGWAKFYKQTVLLSAFDLPEFRSVFNSQCRNYRGKVRQVMEVRVGSIRQCVMQVPQTFHRVEVTSIEASFDARFYYFVNVILPQFTTATMAHTLVYVPSYFDFVRLRNHFKKDVSTSCVHVCEYTREGKVARARDMFYHSGAHFLLYTERGHFFRRPRVKGIRHLVFYQPPAWPHFYPEMVNLMQPANQNPRDGLELNMSVTVLYTKYDVVQLAGIVATQNAQEMVASAKKTHLFVTEK